ncbi:hypothetical protein SDC9_101227 [bioreactor metagenome]|uniref:Uncharacterized protein n=1 Tax=bioreactor metagenome TaxID=1076179 RepID=A0A645AMR8_9ZZZZ
MMASSLEFRWYHNATHDTTVAIAVAQATPRIPHPNTKTKIISSAILSTKDNTTK